LTVSPWRLLEFWIPYPFGPTWAGEPRAIWGTPAFGGLTMGYFVTLYAGSFAALAAVALWRDRAQGMRFLRALVVLGLVLSVLPSFVPQAWRSWQSPLPFRYPEKMAAALALAAAVFAGLGFDRLGSRKARRWPLALAGVFAALAILAAMAPSAFGRSAASLLGGAASTAKA